MEPQMIQNRKQGELDKLDLINNHQLITSYQMEHQMIRTRKQGKLEKLDLIKITIIS